LREQLEAVLRARAERRSGIVAAPLIAAEPIAYLATLDNHLAFELGDGILLVSFTMMK